MVVLLRSTFTMAHVQKILHLLPDAYVFAWRSSPSLQEQKHEPPVLTIRKKRVTSSPEGQDDLPETLSDRVNAFNERVNVLVHEAIATLKQERQEISDQELETALESLELKLAPSPASQAPAAPTPQALPSARDATKELTPMERLAQAQAEVDALAAPVPSDLQSLPNWLIDKVRRREQQGKQTARKSEQATQQTVLRTLPQLSDQIESYALFKRKRVFPVQELRTNLTRAPLKDKIEEQIHALEELVPFWLTVLSKDGKDYVKLSRSHKYNAVKAELRTAIDERLASDK